jgi:acetylornithine deacetylase/succinyl-diaminopimelate desuccinylase-like protein
MKGEVASLAANLLRLKAEGYRPRRDIVVAFTSDEESGGTLSGAEWLLREHRALVEAEFIVNPDGGGGELMNGQRRALHLQTAEKVYASFRFEATSPGGHSSLPVPGNAVYRLAAAIDRLGRFDFPARTSDTTREYFGRLAASAVEPAASAMRRVGRGELADSDLGVLGEEPLYNAMLRTTCVATMLEAGHAEAALAQRASATVQCRLFPGETVEQTLVTLATVVNDPTVTVSVIGTPVPSPASPLDPQVLRTVEQVSAGLWPGVPVLPVMDPGSTDSYYFRLAGIPAYGISGLFTDPGNNGVHGRDERLGIEAFHEGGEFDYRLMKALSR